VFVNIPAKSGTGEAPNAGAASAAVLLPAEYELNVLKLLFHMGGRKNAHSGIYP